MEKTKNCPYCGEEIMADARKCKHCGEWLDESFVQDQDSKANKRESETDAKPKQNNSAVLPQSGSLKETTPIKKNKKWLLAVIPVAIAVFCAGLYFGGVFGHDQFGGKNMRTKDNTEIGQKPSEEDEIKAEIKKQVLEAFDNGSLYAIMTSDFEETMNLAYGLHEIHVTHSFADYFNLLFVNNEVFRIKEVNLINKDKAEVKVSAGDESPVFVMVRDKQSSNTNSIWLLDDVCSWCGLSSMKREIEDFSNSLDWDKAVNQWEEEMSGYEAEYNEITEAKEVGSLAHHFMGTVANVGVHMSMIIDGSSVNGKCYYDSQGKKENTTINIYGTSYNNYLKLTESVKGKTTGLYEGNWESPVYKGTFTRQKDGEKFSFYLVETEGGAAFFTEEELVN